MKLKFPKKIRVGDTWFRVKLDPKITGGEFYYWDEDKKSRPTQGELIIGTYLLKLNPTRVLNTIIHELKEIIQVEQGVRFKDPTEDKNYQFHYYHKEHTDLCSRLAALLEEFIK